MAKRDMIEAILTRAYNIGLEFDWDLMASKISDRDAIVGMKLLAWHRARSVDFIHDFVYLRDGCTFNNDLRISLIN